MTAKIFRSAFFTSFIVLAVSAALIMCVLFGVFENLMQNELVNRRQTIYNTQSAAMPKAF